MSVRRIRVRAASVQARCGSATDIDLAFVGMFEQASDVEEGRLSGTGWRNERDGLPFPQSQGGTVKDRQCGFALLVAAMDIMQINDRDFLLLVLHPRAHSYLRASMGSRRAARHDG